MKEVQPIISLSNMSSFWKVRFDPLSQHSASLYTWSVLTHISEVEDAREKNKSITIQNINVKQKYFLSPLFM